MRRSTILMLGTLAILAVIVWGAVVLQELRRPRVVPVPTRLSTGPLTEGTVTQTFTITLNGLIVDADTGFQVPVAVVRVHLPPSTGGQRGGVLDSSGPTFQAHILANRVSTLTVVAPGYVALEQQMKPHYQRDATLSMDIPLDPVDLDRYRPHPGRPQRRLQRVQVRSLPPPGRSRYPHRRGTLS